MTEKSALSIRRKLPCQIGKSLNGRTEHHGKDNDVHACDITLRNLMLEPEEVDALLGDGAAKALFVKDGKFDKPSEFVARSKTPFELEAKFKDSRVVLFLGMDQEEVELDRCALARIKYDPQPGGLTAFSVQVQATPEAAAMANLFAHMNTDASCTIRFGKVEKNDKQDELPMNATKDGKDETDDEGDGND